MRLSDRCDVSPMYAEMLAGRLGAAAGVAPGCEDLIDGRLYPVAGSVAGQTLLHTAHTRPAYRLLGAGIF